MKNLCTALCVCAALAVGASTSLASTISVASGAELQSALVTAQHGDTILLARGTLYLGNFTLPDKGPSALVITIRTTGDDGLARDIHRR